MLREFNSDSNSDAHSKFGQSLLSKLVFWWLGPFLDVGFSRPLEKEGTLRLKYIAYIFQCAPSKTFGSFPTLDRRPPCRRNSKITFIRGVRQTRDPSVITHSIFLPYHPKRKNQHRHLGITRTRKARRRLPIIGSGLGSTRNRRFSRPIPLAMRNMIRLSLRLFIGYSLCAGGQLEYWY
jgi:hypothetical protein